MLVQYKTYNEQLNNILQYNNILDLRNKRLIHFLS